MNINEWAYLNKEALFEGFDNKEYPDGTMVPEGTKYHDYVRIMYKEFSDEF